MVTWHFCFSQVVAIKTDELVTFAHTVTVDKLEEVNLAACPETLT